VNSPERESVTPDATSKVGAGPLESSSRKSKWRPKPSLGSSVPAPSGRAFSGNTRLGGSAANPSQVRERKTAAQSFLIVIELSLKKTKHDTSLDLMAGIRRRHANDNVELSRQFSHLRSFQRLKRYHNRLLLFGVRDRSHDSIILIQFVPFDVAL